ncbi:hypothetical protein AUEXF2481DRAFT_29764 [Aureobasidium subglaciale EXF-2481]|uniref:Protein LOT5 n=1 Tax=Aureobasidium subglaciale (strain EXF-2481) TaxID=1043005 RepID=A0A074YLQ4_AURSE|nr:uncharacterized protein AUEXF2481DRAFT_29764 [Aureobasidium subglaciale EXF-2481]KAI5211625.1 hypothetical protein E4T38_01198 [Aureobasidium subglaciale]KAI5230395.1 hypothetical protein E4T40_01199 [Aureobasidium subglaciale]KAI5233533.1 hypothetical protein E4T41_01197 [Aureobasidium subglaciale]KAI5266897.1 hypothetical protein E4T46_01197 [Aureobasidium subglaciale]KEQ95037.1 hypothetical protein AUEXF2481DRAFT_29764 [Aureobasidium subglaciale EXF-2481]
MSGALRVIEISPRESDYTSLQAHQEETPGSFYDGKAVLHHRVQNASLKVSERELASNSTLQALRTSAGPGAGPHASPHSHTNGNGEEPRVEVTITRIQIWVTSEFFTLWSTTAGTGVQIPYRTISLHARQQNALYLQLCLSDMAQTADDDLETVELLLTPEPVADNDATDAAEKLFTAVSDCADLHPDPDSDEDQDQEQEPEPGTGGWITSENMQDFMDENGNFQMPEIGTLGAGAGSVRTADQFEDADAGDEVDGNEATDATKWRRTS